MSRGLGDMYKRQVLPHDFLQPMPFALCTNNITVGFETAFEMTLLHLKVCLESTRLFALLWSKTACGESISGMLSHSG